MLLLKRRHILVFLTARPSEAPTTSPAKIEFHDVGKYHPIFEKVVAYAHDRGLKIGLQLWEDFLDFLLKMPNASLVKMRRSLTTTVPSN